MKIGLPRGLLYYKYSPYWETFLVNIGFEVVVSPPTTRKLLKEGLIHAESEICLPVKVFYGHIASLIGKVDAIFIPRVVSVEGKSYTCPKFLGLPDMIKAAFPKIKIFSPTINARKGLKGYYRHLLMFAKQFGTGTMKAISAIMAAEKSQKQYISDLHKGKLPITITNVNKTSENNLENSKVVVGIAGHAYNIFDEYLSVGLIKKLIERGVQVVTPENVPQRIWEKYSSRLPKHLFWTYEKELIGASLYWLENRLIDGLIYVMSFACGPDSIVQYVLEDEARKYNTPIMPLVLDEHTGEAGIITRIEAFLDMLRKKVHS